jgi:hypothetical protein
VDKFILFDDMHYIEVKLAQRALTLLQVLKCRGLS